MSVFQRAFYPTPQACQDPTFTNLFRFLDDFDTYSREVNPRGKNGSGTQQVRRATFNPKFDVRETENTYELHGELPGIDKKDISIDFDENSLTISGRIERNYTAGTPPSAGLVQDNTQRSGANTPTSDTASHRATVTDEADEDGGEAAVVHKGGDQAATTAAAAATPKPNERYWHQERTTGEFHRTFQFPGRVDDSLVSARLDNGILTVSVPKVQKKESRRIDIN